MGVMAFNLLPDSILTNVGAFLPWKKFSWEQIAPGTSGEITDTMRCCALAIKLSPTALIICSG